MTYFKSFAILLAAPLLWACPTAKPPAPDETPPASLAVANDSADLPFIWPRSYDYMNEGATLVFGGTRSWRHDSGIAGASNFWALEADTAGRGIFITEHPGVFAPDHLVKFDVIILNSMTGGILNGNQRAALQNFVEGGGGLIMQHGSGDSSQAEEAEPWPWYADLLGTEFLSHPYDPHLQDARVVTLATGHPVMAGLGDGFNHVDEWYSFTGPVGGDVTVLAGLDESTYLPENFTYGPSDLRMGPAPSDHPIVWAKCPGNGETKGRMVYSALGHNAAMFDAPEHQTLLRNAYDWVSGKVDADGAGCP